LKTHVRGSDINFEMVFKSSAGVIQQVTAATLTIQHPLDGYPLWDGTHTTSYTMTNASTATGQWEYSWDSTPSGGGMVYWNIQPASTVSVSKSGRFLIKSNPAATWLHGPSTVTANDE
jgi:hypothetical protein